VYAKGSTKRYKGDGFFGTLKEMNQKDQDIRIFEY
jgi:hypothetical protein